MKIKHFAFHILLLLIHFHSGFSQNDMKIWSSVQSNFTVSKKLDFKIGFMRSSDFNNKLSLDFNQLSTSISYDITKKINAKLGALGSKSEGADESKNRIFARLTYETKLNKLLTFSNGFQAEKHSKNENRYAYRYIYIGTIGLSHRMKFLKLSPSISTWLYYNQGGNPIQYYSAEGGLPTVKGNPDGLHRARFYLNFNSRISKAISLSVFAMRQSEFNNFSDATHKINVVNPKNNKIIRPFNNYSVVGTTLNLNLNFSKILQKNNTPEIQ